MPESGTTSEVCGAFAETPSRDSEIREHVLTRDPVDRDMAPHGIDRISHNVE